MTASISKPCPSTMLCSVSWAPAPPRFFRLSPDVWPCLKAIRLGRDTCVFANRRVRRTRSQKRWIFRYSSGPAVNFTSLCLLTNYKSKQAPKQKSPAPHGTGLLTSNIRSLSGLLACASARVPEWSGPGHKLRGHRPAAGPPARAPHKPGASGGQRLRCPNRLFLPDSAAASPNPGLSLHCAKLNASRSFFRYHPFRLLALSSPFSAWMPRC